MAPGPALDAYQAVTLAAELARGGASFCVVGGTARALCGSTRRPRDLDLVVAPAEVPLLVGALARVGVDVCASWLLGAGKVALLTAWGPLDVFVSTPPPHGSVMTLGGTVLRVHGG